MANSLPFLSGLSLSVTLDEESVNLAPQLIDADVTFVDANNNFDGGTLALSGLATGDILAIRNEGTDAGEIGVDGASITYEGVVIGTVAGGTGGVALSVTFNAQANSASIESLIENLTYQNLSDVPVYARTFALTVTDAAGAQAVAPVVIQEAIGAANPFNGIDVGGYSAPAFADLDGDGDLDAVIGETDGNLNYFENTGTGVAPVYVLRTGAANPFNGIDVGNHSKPGFADLDSDGDLDAVIGETLGTLKYLENIGTAADAAYIERTDATNPFNGFDVGFHSPPALADLDGDGDLDAVVGEDQGTLKYFENTGTGAAPAYVEQTGAANPFNGVDVGQLSAASFADLDDDGDLDAVVGELAFALSYFENTGTSVAPVYVERSGAANPFNGIDLNQVSAPSFADLDGDGDLDALIGDIYGTLKLFENTGLRSAPSDAEFAVRTGLANPFNGTDVGDRSASTFADLDGDGDLDAVVGEGSGTLNYFENTGTGVAPAYVEQTGAANPFNGIDIGLLSVPGLADLDGDGDLDAVIGEENGTLNYFENTGTSAAPAYVERTGAANPFNVIDVGSLTNPALADLDGDGDLDAVSGELLGMLKYFENTGTSAAPAYVERTGAANPFNGIDVGTYSAPVFADLDGDGDLDTVIGEEYGTLKYFENTGTSAAPAYVERTGAANPFNGIDVGGFSTPSFADLDGDGDLDAAVGESDGSLNYYENAGTGVAPVYVLRTGAANPINSIDVGSESAPSFADLDGDGDLDAVSGEKYGTLRYFENTGSGVAPVYVERTGVANPFNGIDVGTYSAPVFADLDGDGDLDAVIGETDGFLNYYENTGTGAAPVYVLRTGAANPFNGIDVGNESKLAFADLDGDGDLDAIVGELNGFFLNYYENTGTGVAPAYVGRLDAANPFSGFVVGFDGTPFLADLDGDGDLDAVVGEGLGTLNYYENTGTGVAPVYIPRTGAANPFNGIDVGYRSAPSFADLDGDGDLDAVIGEQDGVLNYYENTGTGGFKFVLMVSQHADPSEGADVMNGTDGADTIDALGGNDFIDGGAGNDTLIGGAGNDTLIGGAGNDSLDGGSGTEDVVSFSSSTAGVIVNLALGNAQDGLDGTDTFVNIERVAGSEYADSILGGTGSDYIEGVGGDDTLDGAAGSDTLIGGGGNDTYRVDSQTEVIVENDGEGTDAVISTAGYYVLAANVENLTHGTGGNHWSVGNALANVLTGNDQFDTLEGGSGADSISGGGADDRLFGDAGNDTLDGGGGVDTLFGGADDDLYVLNTYLDVVIEDPSGGTDTLLVEDSYTLPDYVENLTYTGTGNFSGIGNALNNVITAGDGNDLLNGLVGTDTLVGGDGNDNYLVDVVGDVIIEADGEGTDSAYVLGSTYVLGDYVENLYLWSNLPFQQATGNALDNYIVGGDYVDTLDGGAGADTMDGYTGNDTYYVDDPGDVIFDSSGFDTVISTISYTLTAATNYLRLAGTQNIDGTGNGADNQLFGNSGDNVLDSGGGSGDWLQGGSGDDTYIVRTWDVTVIEDVDAGDDIVYASATFSLPDNVEDLVLTEAGISSDGTGNALGNAITGNSYVNHLDGGAGEDTLDGGGGEDLLTGGTGSDVFVAAGAKDYFTDFTTGAGGDQIDLGVLLAGATNYAGGDPFASGHIRLAYAVSDLQGIWIQYDADGGGNSYVTAANVQGSLLITDLTADNFVGGFDPASSPNQAPTTDVTIDATATEGDWVELLTNAIYDPDGANAPSYQWQSSADGLAWSDLAGWTSPAFLPDDAEVGQQIRLVLTYTDARGTLETVYTNATSAVVNVNDAPVAGDDTVAATEDTPLVFAAADLVANDTDAENDTLTVTEVGNALNGAVGLVGGQITFTPNEDFTGTASFEYTMSDGNGGTDTGLVTVNVTAAVNDAPVAVDDTVSAVEDTPATYTSDELVANDTDLDADLLYVYSVTSGTGGTVSITPEQSVVFTPDLNFNGVANFTYLVHDGNGGFDTGAVTVNVAPGNDDPVAFDDTLSATEDTPVTYLAADLVGNDTDIELDTLSIQSVTSGTGGSVVLNGDGTVTFTPGANFNGPVNFNYVVSDGAGGTGSGTVFVNVAAVNDAPVANDDTLAATEDTPVTYLAADLVGNDTDVDLDTLFIESVTSGAGGTVVLNGNGTVTFTPGSNFTGAADFTYVVIDGNGGTDSAAVTVNVSAVNNPPVAVDDTLSATEDTLLTFAAADLVGNDTDVDLDTLTVTAVSNAVNGSVSLVGGQITFTPDANFFGAASFDYTVSDGTDTDSGAVTVDVASVNDAPVAGDDTVAATEDTPLVFAADDLLGNDSDVEDDTLTVTAVGNAVNGTVSLVGGQITFTPDANYYSTASFEYTVSDGTDADTGLVAVNVAAVNDAPVAGDDTVSATEDTQVTYAAADLVGNDTDAENDTLFISAVDGGEGAVLNGDGTVTFTPGANFNGPVNFNYVVSDGNGGTDSGAVTINVAAVNDAPVANDDTLSATEDSPINYSTGAFTSNDSDVDLDMLSILSVTSGAGGTAVLELDGSVTFTPDSNFNGTAGFTYVVSDGTDTDTGAVTVNVAAVNDAPVANDDTLSATEDTPVTYAAADLVGNDTDVDLDLLSIDSVTSGTGGTAVLNGDGTVTFTPGSNFNGTADFNYIVSDGDDGTDEGTVFVNVAAVNDAPVALDDTLAAIEDTPINYTVGAIAGNDSDDDDDTLFIDSVTSGTGGTAVLELDGTVTFTPGSNFNGTAGFTYVVSDGNGGTDSAAVTVNVSAVNDAPMVANAIADQAPTQINNAFAFTFAANTFADVEGDSLTYTATQADDSALPAWLTFTPGTRSFSGTPLVGDIDVIDVKVTANDGNGGSVSEVFTITVVTDNDTLTGGAGDDVLSGGTGDDSLSGGLGNDNLQGNAGIDTLIGNAGNDTLDGGTEGDLAYGSAGDDSILGAAGIDTLVGNAGNDTLNGGTENDQVFGSVGDDYVLGGLGADVVQGNAGNDTVIGGDGTGTDTLDGNDSLDGGAGNDSLSGGFGADNVLGNAGIDTLIGNAGNDTLDGGTEGDLAYGSAGDDSIVGGAGIDTLVGNAGNDTLNGGTEDDQVFGSIGDDYVLGGLGADVVQGNAGNDTVIGGDGTGTDTLDGNDSLDGGAGNDSLSGSFGNDNLVAGAGFDTLIGNAGNDTLDGGADGDLAYGSAGDDSVVGGAGADTLVGNAGNDLLNGGTENDQIFGSTGDDVLIGGAGNDTMQGNAGTDSFRYDALSLNTGDVAAGQADFVTANAAGDLISMLGLNDELTIGNVALSALTANALVGNALNATNNIAFTGGVLQIDLDGNDTFNALNDFQVQLTGVTSVTYNSADDQFHLA